MLAADSHLPRRGEQATEKQDRTECQRFGLSCTPPKQNSGGMKFTKNIGMLLLAIYLIIDGLLGFGLNLGPFIFLLYLLALIAGVMILIGK